MANGTLPAIAAANPDEHATKRLEWLQEIIGRMAANSFLIKGWAITVTSALFALSVKDSDRAFAVLAIHPALVFWALDANYLRLERTFRMQYERLAESQSLSIWSSTPSPTFGRALFATATYPLYLTVLALASLIIARGSS